MQKTQGLCSSTLLSTCDPIFLELWSYFSLKRHLEVIWSDHLLETALTLVNQTYCSEGVQSWRRTCFLEPWQHPLTPSFPRTERSCQSPWRWIREGEAAHPVFKLPCSTHQALPFGCNKTLRSGPTPVFPEREAIQAKTNVHVTSVYRAYVGKAFCEMLNSPLMEAVLAVTEDILHRSTLG